MPASRAVDDMMPILCEMAGLPPDTPLVMYEEVKPNLIESVPFCDGMLEKALEELMDGDILIIQREETDIPVPNYKLPTPKEFSRSVTYLCTIIVIKSTSGRCLL